MARIFVQSTLVFYFALFFIILVLTYTVTDIIKFRKKDEAAKKFTIT